MTLDAGNSLRGVVTQKAYFGRICCANWAERRKAWIQGLAEGGNENTAGQATHLWKHLQSKTRMSTSLSFMTLMEKIKGRVRIQRREHILSHLGE